MKAGIQPREATQRNHRFPIDHW